MPVRGAAQFTGKMPEGYTEDLRRAERHPPQPSTLCGSGWSRSSLINAHRGRLLATPRDTSPRDGHTEWRRQGDCASAAAEAAATAGDETRLRFSEFAAAAGAVVRARQRDRFVDHHRLR